MVSPISISVTAVDRATKVFQNINATVERMQAPVKNLQRSYDRFAQLSGLNRMHESFGRIRGSATSVFRVLGQIAPVLGGITGIATLAGMSRLASSWADFGGNLQNTAQRLGMSTTELQGFQNAARLSGVSAAAMTSGIKNLGDGMWNAVGGRAPQLMATFQQLHVPIQNMDGSLRKTTEVMPELVDRIASIRNPTAQAAVATQLFGSAGEELLPLIRQGSQVMERYRREAMGYGTVSTAGAMAAARLQKAQAALTLSVEGFGNAVAEAVEPVITPVLQSMASWIAVNRQWISQDIAFYVRQFVTWVRSIDWMAVSAGVRQGWASVQGFIGTVRDGIAWLGGLKTVLEAVAMVFGLQLAGSVFGLISPFTSLAMTIGRLVIPAAFSLMAAIGPVGWAVIAVVAAIGGSIAYIYKQWDPLKPWWQNLWNGIWGIIRGFVSSFISGMFPFLNIAASIRKHWDPARGVVQNILNGILGYFKDMAERVKHYIDIVWSALSRVKHAFSSTKQIAVQAKVKVSETDPVQVPVVPTIVDDVPALPSSPLPSLPVKNGPFSAMAMKGASEAVSGSPSSPLPDHPVSAALPISGNLNAMIRQATQGSRVSTADLQALIMTESSGRWQKNAHSSAVGFTQMTRGAAKDMGIDRNDPYQNVLGGRRYYERMLNRMHGNEVAAYAAYHDGEGSVGAKRFLATGDFSGFSPEGLKAARHFSQYLQQAKGGGMPSFGGSSVLPVSGPVRIASQPGMVAGLSNVASVAPISLDSGLGQLPQNGNGAAVQTPAPVPLPSVRNDVASGQRLLLEIEIKNKPASMELTPKSRSPNLTLEAVHYSRAMDPVRSSGGF